MSYTYDLTTDVGKVRAIIPDNKELAYIFENEEVEAFLSMERGGVKRAAALALETIASNETMVLKVIRLLDLQTDGAKVSEALLKRAALLRQQAKADADELAGDDRPAFDVAEMVIDGWQANEYALNSALRGE